MITSEINQTNEAETEAKKMKHGDSEGFGIILFAYSYGTCELLEIKLWQTAYVVSPVHNDESLTVESY